MIKIPILACFCTYVFGTVINAFLCFYSSTVCFIAALLFFSHVPWSISILTVSGLVNNNIHSNCNKTNESNLLRVEDREELLGDCVWGGFFKILTAMYRIQGRSFLITWSMSPDTMWFHLFWIVCGCRVGAAVRFLDKFNNFWVFIPLRSVTISHEKLQVVMFIINDFSAHSLCN